MALSNKGQFAEDVASNFTFFIHNFQDYKEFVFWTDNCSDQNKNWIFYALLVKEANFINVIMNKIVIKYFEPGHTFMSADSFHHKIEQGMKKKKQVEDFQDLNRSSQCMRKVFCYGLQKFLACSLWCLPG